MKFVGRTDAEIVVIAKRLRAMLDDRNKEISRETTSRVDKGWAAHTSGLKLVLVDPSLERDIREHGIVSLSVDINKKLHIKFSNDRDRIYHIDDSLFYIVEYPDFDLNSILVPLR